jgi:hypothetical protein
MICRKKTVQGSEFWVQRFKVNPLVAKTRPNSFESEFTTERITAVGLKLNDEPRTLNLEPLNPEPISPEPLNLKGTA